MSALKELKLSEKAKHLIKHIVKSVRNPKVKVIVLEGTTQSSKTTDVAMAIILAVMASAEKFHIIAGVEVAAIEKNYINDDKVGILSMFPNVRYFGRGDKDEKKPHLKVYMPDGSYKIIRIFDFKKGDTWESFRTGVYGIVVLDEANLCHPRTLSEAMLRGSELRILTLNPDAPDAPVYKYVNHCRPYPKYIDDYPQQLLNELNAEPRPGWEHWYFSFKDNASLSEERIHEIINSEEPNTPRYLSLILGLRQKPDGLCYPSFRKNNILSRYEINKYLEDNDDEFVQFSAGLDTSYSGNTYDTNAMMFIGITNKKKLFVLEEKILSNKKQRENNKQLYGPSDICKIYKMFCDECCYKWHAYLNEIYIDSADSATFTEWDNVFELKDPGYLLIKAMKTRLSVNDRVLVVDSWMHDLDYYINDTCTEHIAECQKYVWDDVSIEKGKKKPVDKDNHTIDSCAYAYIPWVTGLYHMVGNGPAEIRQIGTEV